MYKEYLEGEKWFSFFSFLFANFGGGSSKKKFQNLDKYSVTMDKFGG